MAAPPSATIDETGRFVGGCAWVELRLFEVAGALVAAVSEPEAKAQLAAQSRHHAWHAELWLGHRPEIAGRDADALVAPPGPGWAAAVEALGALPDDPRGVVALAGLVRVALPRLVVACDRRLATCSRVADEALARTVRLVTHDLIEDWRAGERLLQDLVRSHDEAALAGAHLARVEAHLLAGPSRP